MVEKIALNIAIPSINTEHNFIVPEDMAVDTSISLILKTLSEEYRGIQRTSLKGNSLVQKNTGKMLNPGCSFKQLGIIQGDDLLLI